MKKCIILANGNPPPKKIFNYLVLKGFDTLICTDGGANTAVKYNLIPDYIIGDLDSILPSTYDYYYDRCKIMQIKRQNDTDVEKCIKFAIKKKYSEVILLGATGDRLDHTFGNLGIVLKYFDKIKIRILHMKSLLSAYEGNVLLNTVPKETLSIYAFDTKTRITSSGLKYPLKNTALPFGKKESTSNVAISTEVKLKITNGKIFVIRNYEALKSHGIF